MVIILITLTVQVILILIAIPFLLGKTVLLSNRIFPISTISTQNLIGEKKKQIMEVYKFTCFPKVTKEELSNQV